ncbi:unnamed protein product [Phytomonas sp. EM1]|nr:unnamed protein product [Phytomonas sp. EM1]|eukprot:CCW65464.1 unnamed protein product [Phytomonas sp. isolate EM1]
MQTCAVIGCGAAGMATTATLRQNGLLVTCFEIASAPGGIWQSNSRDSFSSRGLISPIYPTMRCVLPKDLMAFSEVRFDYTVPHFPHHSSVQHYLNQCAERKGIHGMTRFNTKVESVRFDCRDGMWKLITVNIVNGDVMEYSFDKVCVCTGQTHEPHYPVGLKELLSDYTREGGELHHASHVKDFRSLKNKRVVVLGDDVTAYDYCVELKRFGADVYHSTLFKRPGIAGSADLDPSATLYQGFQYNAAAGSAPGSMETSMGRSFWRRFLKSSEGPAPLTKGAIRDVATLVSLLLQRIPGWRYDVHKANELLQKWMRYRNEHIETIPRVGYPLKTEHKGILWAADPTRQMRHVEVLEEAEMRRLGRRSRPGPEDEGTFIDNVDVVISATGYKQRFPFLHPSLRRELEADPSCLLPAPDMTVNSAQGITHNKRGLYLGTIYAEKPSLAFVGMQRELLPPFMMFEIQARFIAHAFTERFKLPPTSADMAADEESLLIQNPLLTDLYNPRGLGLYSATYFNVLQRQLGLGAQETYTSKLFERYRWFLMSSGLRVYHKFRSMAPLKRKKQHILFSNAI